MKHRKGLILAGGAGTRLYPITRGISKQLIPVYDKPMIYYPLSVLMRGGMREVLIISTPHDLPNFEKIFGDGSWLGMQISYIEQPEPRGLAEAFILGADFLDGAPSSLILGDNLFWGSSFTDAYTEAVRQERGATVFGYPVADPTAYGVVEFNADGLAISLEEKPCQPKSNYAVPGVYVYDERAVEIARNLEPSARGELEITDLNRVYLDKGELEVKKLRHGVAWLDTGTPDAMLEAAQFVQTIQHRTDLRVACIEEIAFDNGWIDVKELEILAEGMAKTSYGSYLKTLVREEMMPKGQGQGLQ